MAGGGTAHHNTTDLYRPSHASLMVVATMGWGSILYDCNNQLAALTDKQLSHIEGQTPDLFEWQMTKPYWGTNTWSFLNDKQLSHIEGQTLGPFGVTNNWAILRDNTWPFWCDKQLSHIGGQTLGPFGVTNNRAILGDKHLALLVWHTIGDKQLVLFRWQIIEPYWRTSSWSFLSDIQWVLLGDKQPSLIEGQIVGKKLWYRLKLHYALEIALVITGMVFLILNHAFWSFADRWHLHYKLI